MPATDRRAFLRWLGASAAGATALVHAAPEAKRRPSVVLFYSDDQGYADLGCYGSTDIATPNLDRLAAAGARFTDYYSAAPICSPSRAALLTGRSPHAAGVPGNVRAGKDVVGLPGEQVTIAEMLKHAGYRTACFGKWHLGTAPQSHPLGQGFDEFFGHLYGCISYYDHIFSWDRRLGPVHDLWRGKKEVHEDGKYMTDLITREALRFLAQVGDQPFFLYLPYNAPHYPMEAPKKWMELYRHLGTNRQPYAAMVSALDESIGKVVAAVRHIGRADDTLFLFASDNGPSNESRTKVEDQGPMPGSAGPFRGTKFSLWEGGIRMPCIAAWAGHIEPGTVVAEPAIAMDILATIADAAGLEPPEGVEGHSLMPLFAGKGLPQRPLVWRRGNQWAVRLGRWKLLSRRGRKPQLFDLQEDPGEQKDLAGEQPELVERLRGLVQK
ncbi:MAG: sulfatase-like hydrolase/transferase [bacterium]